MASDTTEDEVSKPLPGGSMEACVRRFEDDPEVDDPEAFCGWLEANKENEVVSTWDPEDGLGDLLTALNDPEAEKVLQNLTVTYVSGVENPAQDSQWVMAKDADDRGADWGVSAPLVLKEEPPMPEEGEGGEAVDEEQKAWAPVLIPNETDKQGDVIPVGEIEQAAHKFLANYRKVDTDHDLMEGKGTPIESWTLKQDTTFSLPNGDGETREYPAGTWMLGVKFNDEAWERVKSGELQGFSIYGEAENTPVEEVLGLSAEDEIDRSAGSPVALAKSAQEVQETVKNTNSIMSDDNDNPDGEGGTEATLESIKSTVEDNNTLAKETREDVNDLEKSHEDLADRVDTLESDLEAVKEDDEDEDEDEEDEDAEGESKETPEDAVTEEDLAEAKEDLAEDLKEETEESAAKAAEAAVKSLLGLEEEDLPEDTDERREVLRKGLMEPDEDGGTGGQIGFTAEDVTNAVQGGN